MRRTLLALFSAICLISHAQQPAGDTPPQLTPAQVGAIVDSLSRRLSQHYVFPDSARKMTDYLSSQFRKGAYAGIKDPQQLNQQLWMDMQKAHHDGHLRLMYNPQLARDLADTTRNPQREKEEHVRQLADMQARNFAFVRTEILQGNIGYVRFDGFVGFIDEATPTVASAFRFVAHTKALIIDMRYNGGGSPWMVGRVESFFFPVRTHMNDIVNRDHGTVEVWTDPTKTDSLVLTMPVYILTSRRTFSGAEDFTYGMQSIHRAVIVGDTTGGGAHPTGPYPVTMGFVAMIPSGRSMNPITHTDWEGTGVRPDIPAVSDNALAAAETDFFTRQLQQAGAEEEKNSIQWQLNNLLATQNTTSPDSATLAAYKGVYQGGLDFYVRGHDLYCRNEERGGNIFKLLYIKPDNFVLDENVEVEFVRDAAGKVTGFKMHWSRGQVSFKSLL